jgi:hypothetical protein
MPNFRGPFFVVIEYHSSFGPHRMQIPTKDWSPPAFGADFGLFEKWEGGQIDADLMISNLVGKLKAFLTPDSVFDNYTIFSQPTDTVGAVPVMANDLGATVGTAAASWDQATQMTVNFRTSLFGKAKLVLLDFSALDDWSKVRTLPGSGALFDLVGEFTASTNGWQGQDNGQPTTFVSVTRTLNEKLRRSYRLT